MSGIGDTAAEVRFRAVFAHCGDVAAYARRRGSRDPEAIAAETMTIAWRKLADVPLDDPRPWLFATARHLLQAEWRRERLAATARAVCASEGLEPAAEIRVLDPQLVAALRQLSPTDREALLLVAWEDLSSAQAARSLGLSQVAFRVRLHRARRRLRDVLARTAADPPLQRVEVEAR